MAVGRKETEAMSSGESTQLGHSLNLRDEEKKSKVMLSSRGMPFNKIQNIRRGMNSGKERGHVHTH